MCWRMKICDPALSSVARAYRRGLERALAEIRERSDAGRCAESDIDAVSAIEDVIDSLDGDADEAGSLELIIGTIDRSGQYRREDGQSSGSSKAIRMPEPLCYECLRHHAGWVVDRDGRGRCDPKGAR